MPDAGVNNPARILSQQFAAQLLRTPVAVGIHVSRESPVPEIVKFAVEVGQVRGHLHIGIEPPPDLLKFPRTMMNRFGMSGRDRESRIPCSAACVIEASAARMWMTERGHNHRRERLAGDPFLPRD